MSTTVHYCPHLSTTFTVHLCLLNVRLFPPPPPQFPTVMSGHLCENTVHYNVQCYQVLSAFVHHKPISSAVANVQCPWSTPGHQTSTDFHRRPIPVHHCPLKYSLLYTVTIGHYCLVSTIATIFHHCPLQYSLLLSQLATHCPLLPTIVYQC